MRSQSVVDERKKERKKSSFTVDEVDAIINQHLEVVGRSRRKKTKMKKKPSYKCFV